MPAKSPCPFCRVDPKSLWFETKHGRVIHDAYPISKGHMLVVPRPHIQSVYDLDTDTQAALFKLVSDVRRRLNEKYHPDGFNVGLNDGEAAGQTVMHAHIHVIPRWTNDVADPRGGVRWIIPDKARYWGDE